MTPLLKLNKELKMKNIRNLSKLMLMSNFICTLFYSLSYPYIYAETIKVVTQPYIAFEQIISCLGIILFSTVWNKYGDYLFKHYAKIVIIEVIADLYLFLDVLIRNDLKFYFVLNVLIYAIITKNLSCGGIKMRAKVNPTDTLRESYDNNANIVNSLATLIGSGLALVFKLDINTLFVFALIGNISDNFFYLYIYSKIKED